MTEKKKNIPELRFPEFKEAWKSYRIEDVSKKIGDGIHSTPIYDDYGEYYFINGNNLISGKIIFDNTTKKISSETFSNYNSHLELGSILLSINGTIGNIAYYNNEKILLGKSACYINVKKEYVKEFIYYSLQTKYLLKYFYSELTGSTIKNLSLYSIRKAIYYFPIKNEQQKIASFLTSVDKRIQQLTKKKELLEKYKKGIMQKIFSQQIRFKDDDGKDFPDWKNKKLGYLTYKVGKKNKDNLRLPIYSISNKYGFIPQNEQFEGVDSNSRGYDISLYKIIEKNTFAYNPARINVGSIGYSADLENIIISSLYVCFKTNSELDDNYLKQYLTTYNFNKSVLRNTEGGVRDYLFFENFSNIKIPIPSVSEQQKIADFLSSIDKKIEAVITQLEKTKEFKKGLLQKMFV
ncbi:MAG: restriction endonuclease subunit S [Melioribacteraceae bacterium]|nr:restriction endonuclease subunit S [Melioribacteraceae bacterium]